MGRRVTVLGGGAMGTACAVLLAGQPETSVTLWLRQPADAARLGSTRCNDRYLPGYELPPEIEVTSDPKQALAGAEWIVAAVPTAFLRDTLSPLAVHVPTGVPVVSVIKGIEAGSLARPSEIVTGVFGPRPVVALCGPSHAEEMVERYPASVVAAGHDEAVCQAVVELFRTARFRVYSNRDLVGVELAGALKNVVAIAAGVSDGLGFGDNAKAALLTRACFELARLVQHLGGKPGTLFGLAGMGDLITSCFSPHGRNRAVGLEIGRGRSLQEAIHSVRGVAEGVNTCGSVQAITRRDGLELPILTAVHQILFEEVAPRDAVTALMTRPPRRETLEIVLQPD